MDLNHGRLLLAVCCQVVESESQQLQVLSTVALTFRLFVGSDSCHFHLLQDLEAFPVAACFDQAESLFVHHNDELVERQFKLALVFSRQAILARRMAIGVF